MLVEEFGHLKDGRKATLFTMDNENISVSLTDYGAALVRFIDKASGTDVVLGYDSVDAYAQSPYYFGASIGRLANRVKDGRLVIGDQTYQLAQNDRGNHLHGGREGFDKKLFAADHADDWIVFSYTSTDGEENYPGELYVTVRYELMTDGLRIIATGSAEDDTVFAYTHHAYFNLTGGDEVTAHTLQVCSDVYAPNDDCSLALATPQQVAGSAFDLRAPKRIGEVLAAKDEQLLLSGGLDHHFPVPGSGLRKMARYDAGTRALEMWSDFPGLHVYTPNFRAPHPGKGGDRYTGRAAICLEAEYYPNSVNYAQVKEKPFVPKGGALTHSIEYRLTK